MPSVSLPVSPLPRSRWVIPAGVVTLAILAYLPAMRAGFIWDDDSYVERNVALRSLYGLWLIWSHTFSTPQYYPLVHTTFWIEYHLWGISSAIPFHIVNVLIHATSAVLLGRLLTKLRVPGAWLAAAIWAVHPINVESVAWVTERKNVMSAVFYLLAFGMYLRAIEGETLDRRRYGGALTLFVAALLSKTVASTMPAAILVVLWWQRGRLVRRDFVRLIPFFVIGAAMGSLTGYLERTQVGAHGPLWSSLTFVDRVLIASRAVWFYAGKFVWPAKLIFIYPRWVIDSKQLLAWSFFVAAFAVLILLVGMTRRWGRGPLALGLLYVGTLAPALGFVNVYPMRYSFVADHFAYLATAALAIGVGWLISKLDPNRRSASDAGLGKRARVVGVVLLIALASRTFARTFDFYDRLTLWRKTVADNPNSAMVHTNLGHALVADKQPDAAWAEYLESLRIAPNDAESHTNIGIGLANRGDLNGAAEQFKQVMAIDPSDLTSYGFLAKLYVDARQYDLAELWARRGLTVAPHAAVSHLVLGHVFQAAGRLPAAIEEYKQAAAEEPLRAGAHADVAAACIAAGRLPDALVELQTAVALDPTNSQWWTMLGTLQMAGGQSDESANSFQQALAIDPNNQQAKLQLQLVTGASRRS